MINVRRKVENTDGSYIEEVFTLQVNMVKTTIVVMVRNIDVYEKKSKIHKRKHILHLNKEDNKELFIKYMQEHNVKMDVWDLMQEAIRIR